MDDIQPFDGGQVRTDQEVWTVVISDPNIPDSGEEMDFIGPVGSTNHAKHLAAHAWASENLVPNMNKVVIVPYAGVWIRHI